MLEKSHLLILTYEMDESSTVYSHQVGVVNELSNYFDKVTVLTGKLGIFKVAPNVVVYSSQWIPGKRIFNSLKVIWYFLRLVKSNKFSVILSHMVSTQSALISPISRVLRIRHFLWYTHTSKSRALKICHKLTDGILTATPGSCPISSPKIHVVGHSIDSKLFSKSDFLNYPIVNFVHAGRFDPIKKVEFIIDTLEDCRNNYPNITFTQIGGASGPKYSVYKNTIMNDSRNKDWCNFFDSVARADLPSKLKTFDVFVHACDAGLDKAALEATFIGIPVVTINKQYLEIFGSWNFKNKGVLVSLKEEINGLLSLSESELRVELDKRYASVFKGFEVGGWALRVSEILKKL